MSTHQLTPALKLPSLTLTLPTSSSSSSSHSPSTTPSSTTPVSAQGMHSPPRDDIDMTSAPPTTTTTLSMEAPSESSHNAVVAQLDPASATAAAAGTKGHFAGAASLTPLSKGDTLVKENPDILAHVPGLVKDQSDTDVSMTSDSGPDCSQDSNGSGHSDDSMTDNHKNDLRRLQRHQSKEKAIEQVLQKGKILKVSRRLRTRLEYAILKIRRGWSKYTLQEVESLVQPACSPRITARHLATGTKPSSASSSPRQSERKRVKKVYPQYEETSYRKGTPTTEDQDQDTEMTVQAPPPPATARRFKSRPSLSQYSESELFQPAKSLMDIATSKPEPGYSSPYLGSASASPMIAHQHHQPGDHSPYHRFGTPEPLYRESTPVKDAYPQNRWSGYSAPTTPVNNSIASFDTNNEEQDDSGVPSAAQAARTILMLSSPTGPPPRALNQNYIFNMHSGSPTTTPIAEWSGPYSPMTSSPLVHFQTAAPSPPSNGNNSSGHQTPDGMRTPPPSGGKELNLGHYGMGGGGGGVHHSVDAALRRRRGSGLSAGSGASTDLAAMFRASSNAHHAQTASGTASPQH